MKIDKDTGNTTLNPEPNWWSLAAISFGFVLAFFLIVGTIQFSIASTIQSEDGDYSIFGITGDFFGSANALFSALAFAAFIVTLLMQRYELSEQRRELKLTQDIFREQKREMEDQNESLRMQTFENTFFKLLELHSGIVSTITLHGKQKSGREMFKVMLDEIQVEPESRGGRVTTPQRRNFSVEKYESWYEKHQNDVGHYFRTLYNTMRYVDENGGAKKPTYSRLVRAQLSSNELQLMLYNGLSKHGKPKFKPLIERYALLKHLSPSDDDQQFRDQYDESAFGPISDVANEQGGSDSK